jgi:hypothetical protein
MYTIALAPISTQNCVPLCDSPLPACPCRTRTRARCRIALPSNEAHHNKAFLAPPHPTAPAPTGARCHIVWNEDEPITHVISGKQSKTVDRGIKLNIHVVNEYWLHQSSIRWRRVAEEVLQYCSPNIPPSRPHNSAFTTRRASARGEARQMA